MIEGVWSRVQGLGRVLFMDVKLRFRIGKGSVSRVRHSAPLRPHLCTGSSSVHVALLWGGHASLGLVRHMNLPLRFGTETSSADSKPARGREVVEGSGGFFLYRVGVVGFRPQFLHRMRLTPFYTVFYTLRFTPHCGENRARCSDW